MDPEATLLAELQTIERIAAAIAARHRLSPDEHDDFLGQVKLRLIENDYAVFRKFEGRSLLATYLQTVIVNYFGDYRNANWGRWRVSAAAKRLGPIAERLEALIYRDDYSPSDAVQRLRVLHGTVESESSLLRLAAKIPQRFKPRKVSDAAAAALPTANTADAMLHERQLDEARAEVVSVIEASLADLSPDDRLIMRMYLNDRGVAEIARALTLDQKRLYRRLPKLVDSFRRALESRGIDRERLTRLRADSARRESNDHLAF